jgi:hypothetical protein
LSRLGPAPVGFDEAISAVPRDEHRLHASPDRTGQLVHRWPTGDQTVLRTIRVTRSGGGRPRTRPDLVLADKAYTSKGNRGHLRSRGIKACISSETDQDAHRKAKGS